MMKISPEARVWALLILLTVANWLLMEWGLWDHSIAPILVDAAILLLALVKVRLIVRYFMEVRDAPKPLGWLFDGWLAIVAISLIVQAAT